MRLSFLNRTRERTHSPRSVLTDHRPATHIGPTRRDHVVGERWTGGAWITAKLTSVGLWLLIACGPVGLIVALAAARGPAPPTDRTASPVVDAQAISDAAAAERNAAELAQGFVVAWLSTAQGEEKRLEAFGIDTSGFRLPETAAMASNSAAADVTEVQPGVWSVRIGVDVTWPAPVVAGDEPGDNLNDADAAKSAPPTQRQYFQVVVERNGDGLAVQTLPAPVPAEATSTASRLVYGERVPPGDEVFDTAAGFLRALLTGDGDLTRYVAPAADLVPITPPPYSAVEMVEVRVGHLVQPSPDGTTTRLLATAVAVSLGGQELTVQYPLVMTARDGRWEVVEISQTAATSRSLADAESDATP